jgi:hypothetical protein
MVVRAVPGHKSAHQLAFLHYLRTGQRLTTAEWLAQEEHKFNPYHDPKNGRFTFAPGGSQQGGGSAAQAKPSSSKVEPVKNYPEGGKDSWRKSNDAVYEKAANDWNQQHNLNPGDPRYIDPQFLKAWSMVESGGDKSEFLTDPFQVNKDGDWVREKANYGLSKGQKMTPEASS